MIPNPIDLPAAWGNVEAALDPAEIVGLARRLVAIPSHSAEHDWEDGVAAALGDVLSHDGLLIEQIPALDRRSNLLAVLPGLRDGLPLLMLNGHMDTVPPSGSMRYPPFAAEIRDGQLWGRGAVDMKGGLAAMTMALVALRRAGIRPPRPIVLAAVVAEETGNVGSAALGTAGRMASMAVVGEPTGLNIVPAHRGVDRYQVVVRGRAAHGSTPDRGVNAIVLAARLIVDLSARLPDMWRTQAHALLGRPSFNIGTIHGGVTRNVVPDRCEFSFDKRWIPGDSLPQIRADLETVIAASIGAETTQIIHDPQFDRIPHPPLDTGRDHRLVRELMAAADAILSHPGTIGQFDAFTDAAILQAGGTPAVVFGPGDLAVAHSDDEHIALDELHAAARIYALLAVRLCGAESG